MHPMHKGHFIISLDFELHWGIFDHTSVAAYQSHLDQVPQIIDRLLELGDRYGVHYTFATVGFLFADSKAQLKEFSPKNAPAYAHEHYSPYRLFSSIGDNPQSDPYHYAPQLIDQIQQQGIHEIGTHTFSHYYCLEEGPTEADFDADIKAAKRIAAQRGIEIESIVFPRNQAVPSYVKVCEANGISSFRGSEDHWMYQPVPAATKNWKARLFRLLDCYWNISGYHTYSVENTGGILNLPSSRFLRPYNHRLRWLEPLKLRRIKKAMAHAARNKEVFHLWWHPHNFGSHTDRNFAQLESICQEYQRLQSLGFESVTMTQLTEKIKA